MDTSAYLARIGLSHDQLAVLSDLEKLQTLQKAHLHTVPFENLSIHSGEQIQLDPEWLFDKIVVRRRGGFCYELNGLFTELLKALGYSVTRMAARVNSDASGSFGPPFDHLCLRVDLEAPWLVDVGFGRGFIEPLRLDEFGIQQQTEGNFRLTKAGDELIYSNLDSSGDWQPQYIFGLQGYRLDDYSAMCVYHQTSRESPFSRRWACTRKTSPGRVTLTDTELIETIDGVRHETQHDGGADIDRLLISHFGIQGVNLMRDTTDAAT
jgi:N-hydroxyarylamine O-acetyltransferase